MSAGAHSKGDVRVHSIRQNGKRGKQRPMDGYEAEEDMMLEAGGEGEETVIASIDRLARF